MTRKVLKTGDKFLLIRRRLNGDQALSERMFEVVSGSSTNYSFRAKLLEKAGRFAEGKIFDVYPGQDEFAEASKEVMIKYYTGKRDKLIEEISKVDAEIEFHTKYENMEEFVADKIGLLIQADTKESRVAILKTLKQTNYL